MCFLIHKRNVKEADDCIMSRFQGLNKSVRKWLFLILFACFIILYKISRRSSHYHWLQLEVVEDSEMAEYPFLPEDCCLKTSEYFLFVLRQDLTM